MVYLRARSVLYILCVLTYTEWHVAHSITRNSFAAPPNPLATYSFLPPSEPPAAAIFNMALEQFSWDLLLMVSDMFGLMCPRLNPKKGRGHWWDGVNSTSPAKVSVWEATQQEVGAESWLTNLLCHWENISPVSLRKIVHCKKRGGYVFFWHTIPKQCNERNVCYLENGCM